MSSKIGGSSPSPSNIWEGLYIEPKFNVDLETYLEDIVTETTPPPSEQSMLVDETNINSEPLPRKSNWTNAQIRKFTNLIKAHGENWLLIAKEMKMPKDRCYSKWIELNKKNPELALFAKDHLWDGKIDLLINAVKQHGTRKWKKIAEIVGSTENQCRLKWEQLIKNDEDLSKIGKTVLTTNQEAFVSLVRQHGTKWIVISPLTERLSTLQCKIKWDNLKRKYPYLQDLGKEVHIWNQEEEERLVLFVKQHGIANWKTIAEEIGLKVCQCKNKWKLLKTKNPALKSLEKWSEKNWSEEDDEQLIQAVIDFGTYSPAIAEEMKRTKYQCATRWRRLIKKDPTLNDYSTIKKWTEDEDKTLEQLVLQHEGTKRKWVKIGKAMNTAPKRCAMRWKRLNDLQSTISTSNLKVNRLRRIRDIKKS